MTSVSPASKSAIVVPDTLDVGLSAWIVQDGNYGEFSVGQQTSFALEIWFREFTSFAETGSEAIGLEPDTFRGMTRYAVEAEVLHSDARWVALNAGIRAYIDGPIFGGVGGAEDDPIVAEMVVARDEGDDDETANWEDEPAIVSSSIVLASGPAGDANPSYDDWGVKTGNWVTGKVTFGIDHFSYFERLGLASESPAMIYDWVIERIQMETAPFVEDSLGLSRRDESKLACIDVDQTNCWEDDGGRAEYILTCRRMAGEPRNRI